MNMVLIYALSACPQAAIPPKTCMNAFPCQKASHDADSASYFYDWAEAPAEDGWYNDIEIFKHKDNDKPEISKPHKELDVTKSLYNGNPEFLNHFLEDGILEGKGAQFYKAQEKYGINAAFLIAIAKLESNSGKSRLAVENNNFGGMRNKKGWLKFNTVDEGIDALAKNIKTLYLDKGLTTIDAISKKYAEDEKWSKLIVSIMNKMHEYSNISIIKYW